MWIALVLNSTAKKKKQPEKMIFSVTNRVFIHSLFMHYSNDKNNHIWGIFMFVFVIVWMILLFFSSARALSVPVFSEQ